MPFRRNVFIVGAGFSAEAGAPVVSNFFERAMELYKDPISPLQADERKTFQQIFNYRASLQIAEHKVRIDPENIEELFGLAEMAAQLAEPDAEQIRRSLIYVILRTIELTSDRAPKNGNAIFVGDKTRGGQVVNLTGDMYDLFVDIVARRWDALPPDGITQDIIISLNYDVLLEKAMAASPSDVRVAVRRIKNPGSLVPLYDLPAESLEEAAEVSQKALCRVRLLKLHGSANWAWCQSCKRVRVLSLESTSVTFRSPECRCGNSMTRLIVPPAWNKEEYLPFLKSVWISAFKALAEAQRIWIMGYSMPEADKFFQYLLALALRKNTALDQVVIVNRKPEDCQRIAILFRAHHERQRVVAQQEIISYYMRDNQRFQRQLGQYYSTPEFAW